MNSNTIINANVSIPRMRTIRETARENGYPEFAIRRLVREHKIVYIRNASKVMVNLDKFIDYLNGLEVQADDKSCRSYDPDR